MQAAATSINESKLKQDLQRACFKNLEFANAVYVAQATTQSGRSGMQR